MASPVGEARLNQGSLARNFWIVTAKLAVTGTCFWIVARQIDFTTLGAVAKTLDYAWAALATLLLALAIPLVGLRWSVIVDLLAADGTRIRRLPMIAIVAAAVFIGQILPTVAGDGMRVWLFARRGRTWQEGLTSVLIDRGAGILALLAIGFASLWSPSPLAELGGHRAEALWAFGLVLAAVAAALVMIPLVPPVLARWRMTRMIDDFGRSAHRVLVGSSAGFKIFAIAFLTHSATVTAIWCLGRALDIALSLPDAAVLFTLMIAMTVLPISIGGWGLRELAVTTLLQAHGVPAEKALLLSICFGVAGIAATLPGALAWLLYWLRGGAGPRP